ncbi:glycosyltransferase family 2 protein [Spirochaeta isovalerica]|uniref:Glycosyltransferase involved in cell wall biosynthesis n=1 Tax=Spirochaeta isovalerica TaxID=150 RepID=A0A841RBR8_9SPIO|nr:glycosyltransferase family 2 protein [Spirochaeta isovalerica]MBB6479852.1 glycosyltransferase involved in cell wall biosynthesis [Spirochaeta isovalerica]
MTNKILTVVVPSYNSQDYLHRCIDSLLACKDDSLEILIVNDGSRDRTDAIADAYMRNNPGIVRAIHQENKGHGGAVNRGISHAKGKFLKVVDSDDWVDLPSLQSILDKLKELDDQGKTLDLLISNFVYEKEGARFKKTVRYKSVFPEGKIFGWHESRSFRKGQYMLMHSMIYRTGLLRECGLKLPEHTFYVDNLFAFVPLNHVRSLYYIDVNFYRYYIGRADQSVNESVMISRIDQQLKVNQMMLDHMLTSTVFNHKLKKYMRHYLEIIMTVSSILLIRSRQKEHLVQKTDLWHSVKYRDRGLYMSLRFGILGLITHLPGKIGRKISIGIYKLTQLVVGFN